MISGTNKICILKLSRLVKKRKSGRLVENFFFPFFNIDKKQLMIHLQ